jgi:transcription-repair coupling factor (superfamily II helicase)
MIATIQNKIQNKSKNLNRFFCRKKLSPRRRFDDLHTHSMALRRIQKELDDITTEEGMEAFSNNLIDRFGEIPTPTLALIETMRLRWLAREIGFEKLVLKSGKMIGYFITKEHSPFYQSEKFSHVLEFIKLNPSGGKMYEKEGSLRMSFDQVTTLKKAIHILTSLKDGRKL